MRQSPLALISEKQKAKNALHDRLRKQARTRSGWRCEACAVRERDRHAELHHILSAKGHLLSADIAERIETVIMLCGSATLAGTCHYKAHFDQDFKRGLIAIAASRLGLTQQNGESALDAVRRYEREHEAAHLPRPGVRWGRVRHQDDGHPRPAAQGQDVYRIGARRDEQ
jgi:hypothetical protein